jgi:YegS/Rv2252/BmrU family lipid kinase
MNKNYELLINLASRKASEAFSEITNEFQEQGIEFSKINKLSDPTKLHKVLIQIKNRRPKTLVVASGDGTISDVVDYLAETNIELGIIPLGTTNNFARSLDIPLTIKESIKIIVKNNPKKIDLGVFNGDYFANVAGIGISAEIANTIPDSLKKRFGRLAYGIHGIKVLAKHRAFNAIITDKNGKLKLNLKTHQLIIANGSYHAGSEIARDVNLKSNELIVFKLGGTSRLSLIWHLIDFYAGNRKTVNNTAYLIAKDIKIDTGRPILVELDGETKEKTPGHVVVKPSTLLVIH